MKILNKGSIKKKFDKKIHKEEVSKGAKEEAHYMKSDVKNVVGELKTKESLVMKNDAIAILLSGHKNQISFHSEFEKLTREGYMLTGTRSTKGFALKLFGFDIKTGSLFYFQHTKFLSKENP